MKTYVITLSQTFFKGHPRVGEPTHFADKFWAGQTPQSEYWQKIHTIRGNYDLWARRIKEVQERKAVLSIRQWTGKPYNSPQITLATLTIDHGVGIQRVTFNRNELLGMRIDGMKTPSIGKTICVNDGLSFEDFQAWFKGYDLSKPMAIIHFTNFRY